MKKTDLDLQLSALGVDFLGTAEVFDAGKALVEVAGKKELRYWEVFPALLANAVEQGAFNYSLSREKTRPKGLEKPFDDLVCFSLGLYKALGLKFSWAEVLFASLNAKGQRQVGAFKEAFNKGSDVRMGDKFLSAERVKLSFHRYFKPVARSLNGLLTKKEEFGLEYSLSRLFSPKQKELFLKKLQGEKLTKTENEYFSRTVRKKALAVANPELHRLARELVSS